MSYVIGCDLGSQSVKAVIADATGKLLGRGSATLETSFQRPGWASQRPGDWLRAAGEAVRAALAQAGVTGLQVDAIAFASQVDGVVAVDRDNSALCDAIIWMDRRAVREVEEITARVDADRLFEITGLNADAYHIAPKIRWLMANEPRARDADAYLAPSAFINAQLTGRRVMDAANASSTMLYDVTLGEWSAPMLEACELRSEQLGEIAGSATVAGCLTASAANQLGLATTCRVAVGTGDDHGACLGAGVLTPGVVCDVTGTAEPVAAVAHRPIFDATRLLETHLHADASVWLIENAGFVSGGSTRWLADLFEISQQELAELASTAEPQTDGVRFIPALSGSMTPRWNAHVRGVFSGLALSQHRADLARAVFEGCTFALRDVVDRLDELQLAGDELRCVGGGARSPFWLQLKADVTRRLVRVVEAPEPTAMGAVMLAGIATGVVADFEEAASVFVRLSPRTYEPDARLGAIYDEGYRAYRTLFDAVEPTFGASPC